MKKVVVLAVASLAILGCKSTKVTENDLAISNPIATHLDLVNVVEDKVPVTINPGRFTQETVTYRLPKIVQGTYAVSDFGNFIDAFKAFDYEGNELAVVKTDTNTWTIAEAVKLNKITYLANDTFDVEGEGKSPFSPSGTNIAANNYVLNLHGFVGYFDSLKKNQYTLDVVAPASFKRTSALQETKNVASEDGKAVTTSYFAPRYFDITDNPMMYGELDVEEFMVGDIKIVLSVFSPNKVHSAASLKETVFKMMEAQKAYLGAVDATPRYDIYLYLAEQSDTAPTGFGALEHHTSTVVVLPESMPKEALEKSMIDVVAHEFFHIVTPLSVHSEDVHYFDYNAPTFSKHLWMYEGVTEYFAQHFQVVKDLMTEDEFYNVLAGKITSSKTMDDSMSFTEMSENILEDPYAPNYFNVYQKGALIGMCVDILMREESNGNRSILSLMKELSGKYGKNKPFVDDMILDEISTMTYPSVKSFMDTHVVGKTPIDYSTIFNKVGLKFGKVRSKTSYVQSGGAFVFGADREKGRIFFAENIVGNSFWVAQGVQPKDIIKEVNGTEITLTNAQSALQGMMSWKPGQDVEVKLERDGKEVVVKAKLTQAYSESEGIMVDENATEKQLNTRAAWLKG